MAEPRLKEGGLHGERGGSPEWALNLSCDPASPLPSAEPSILGSVVSPPAQSPSPQHSAPFSESKAVSQPSICSPWHGTSLKFLKIAGMLMPPAPLFPTLRQILLFLYSLARSFLSLAEGGGFGGRWTSVLSFPVYSQDGLSLSTLVHRSGVPSTEEESWVFPGP